MYPPCFSGPIFSERMSTILRSHLFVNEQMCIGGMSFCQPTTTMALKGPAPTVDVRMRMRLLQSAHASRAHHPVRLQCSRNVPHIVHADDDWTITDGAGRSDQDSVGRRIRRQG